MVLAPGILGVVMAVASLTVIGLLLHYLSHVGRRYDTLCFYGLLATAFGLLAASIGYRSAQNAPSRVDLFSAICFGLTLCFLATLIWREGLQRFRDAG